MTKVYSFEESQFVIKEAFNLAVKHLEDTLGDQYKCWNTDDARSKFYDKVEQDIKFKMTCGLCGKVDGECEFTEVAMSYDADSVTNICWDCHEIRGNKHGWKQN